MIFNSCVCVLSSYEFETSVRWMVNSTLNPSPCPVGSQADLTQDGELRETPATGERGTHIHISVDK